MNTILGITLDPKEALSENDAEKINNFLATEVLPAMVNADFDSEKVAAVKVLTDYATIAQVTAINAIAAKDAELAKLQAKLLDARELNAKLITQVPASKAGVTQDAPEAPKRSFADIKASLSRLV